MADSVSTASTSVRRVWDKDDAERKYNERLAREKAEDNEAKTKKAEGKLPPPPASSNADSVQARTEAVIKTEELRGKRELVAPILGIGNKGRSAGFYCETCDLTYKDSFSYLDHINSSQRISSFPRSVNARLSQTWDLREGRASVVGTSTSPTGVAQGAQDPVR